MKGIIFFQISLMMSLLGSNVSVPAIASHMLRCDQRDQSSLLHLKHNLVFNSSLSDKLVTWDSSSDCCVWGGITCGADGHVIGLDLSFEWISGGIDEFNSPLFDLHHLQSLDLCYNRFNGTRIPAGISKLVNLLHLNLSLSDFGGQVPAQLSGLTNLLSLNLSYGMSLKLEDPDLSKLVRNMTSLMELRLDDVNLSVGREGDGYEWGHALSSLPRLQVLSLQNCSLSRPLPISLLSLHHLADINLSRNNKLSGTLPAFIGNMVGLRYLHLGQCRFGGSITKIRWENLKNLKDLHLDNNKLEGLIPASIFNLKCLEFLQLSFNNFSGVLDFSNLFQNLGNLIGIYLSFNRLSIIESVGSHVYSSFPNKLFEVSLASCNLKAFPSLLRNQSMLSFIDLSHNNIAGNIPTWIWQPSLWYLNLSHNSLSFASPPNLTSLASLQYLDLHSNQLQGPIPFVPPGVEYTLNFEIISLSNNNFSGSIPVSLCKIRLAMLIRTVIDLSENSLSGTIPRCLIAMESGVLNLKGNNLIGNIPDAFQDGCSIQTLDLSDNYIQGKVPKSIVNCKALEVVNLGNNKLNDWFPCWLMQIPTLRVLVLRSNEFHGPVRCEASGRSSDSSLQIIDIAANNFSGKLPHDIFKAWTNMRAQQGKVMPKAERLGYGSEIGSAYYQDTVTITNKGNFRELEKILTIFNSIDFSCNYFEGSIPPSIGDLRSLQVLNLSHNHLTGQIPSSIGNLNMIESLDLASNSLSGVIPEQLASLTFISYLNLSYNDLVGKIPTSTQLQSFSERSYAGNKGLHGPPLDMICKSTCGSHVDPNTRVDDEEEETDWSLISIFMEIGFVVGLGVAIGSVVFWRRWRLWLFELAERVLFKFFPRFDPNKRKRARKAHRR